MLAKLHRAGEVTAVWVPDDAHEAMRDLIWARSTAARVLGKARQNLQGFLLRHGRVHAGKKGWTLAYGRWLTTVRFDHAAQQLVLQDYIHAVTDAKARVERLIGQIADLAQNWSQAPVVAALQAMPGEAFIVAVNRDRLLEGAIAAKFLAAILAQPRVKRLLSSEHFSVDGTLIEAWASMKSFKPGDGSGDEPPPGSRRNAGVDFKGEKRSNETHASTTDPEAKLYRKGAGMEAKLAALSVQCRRIVSYL